MKPLEIEPVQAVIGVIVVGVALFAFVPSVRETATRLARPLLFPKLRSVP